MPGRYTVSTVSAPLPACRFTVTCDFCTCRFWELPFWSAFRSTVSTCLEQNCLHVFCTTSRSACRCLPFYRSFPRFSGSGSSGYAGLWRFLPAACLRISTVTCLPPGTCLPPACRAPAGFVTCAMPPVLPACRMPADSAGRYRYLPCHLPAAVTVSAVSGALLRYLPLHHRSACLPAVGYHWITACRFCLDTCRCWSTCLPAVLLNYRSADTVTVPALPGILPAPASRLPACRCHLPRKEQVLLPPATTTCLGLFWVGSGVPVDADHCLEPAWVEMRFWVWMPGCSCLPAWEVTCRCRRSAPAYLQVPGVTWRCSALFWVRGSPGGAACCLPAWRCRFLPPACVV